MSSLIGKAIPRREDDRLLRGKGRYVDDIHLPGMLHAAVLRSPYAHARLNRIDAKEAAAMPGVALVLTAADLGERNCPILMPISHSDLTEPRSPWPLAAHKVRYAGEPVVFIVAQSRYVAEDALQHVQIEYEPLPAVSDVELAFRQPPALVHDDVPRNRAAHHTQLVGDASSALAGAPHRSRVRLTAHRGTGHPIETRGVVASYETLERVLTVAATTQQPHRLQRALADACALPEHQVRVITPDVGGGFGAKNAVYPEYLLAAEAALRLGCPVKWIEDRLEHAVSASQERDQVFDAEVGFTGDGRILGLRVHFLHDCGAYTTSGIIVPLITAATIPGPYRVPNYEVSFDAVYTNKVQVTSLRGAGRPQAAFVMERMLDLIAAELELDQAEVRRRNLIQPTDMPYDVGVIFRDGKGVVYDGGDYPESFNRALTAIGAADFPQRQREARTEGRLLGLGFGSYVEGTGLGPYEGAKVRIESTGRIVVICGAPTQGQGHETTFAQICAQELGCRMEDVDVIQGDTSSIAFGVGTFASRVGALGNSAVGVAARRVREKVLALASQVLEVAVHDLEITGREVRCIGAPARTIALSQLALLAAGARYGVAMNMSDGPGLEHSEYFSPERATYSYGTHAAEVAVDPETGLCRIVRYVIVHDCGTVVNPLIVAGQVQGGLAHGIGNALYERLHYDANGTLLNGSLMDYLMPVAADVPHAEQIHLCTPTTRNPYGIRGAGEGGTIPAAAVLLQAVENALELRPGTLRDIPLHPGTVVAHQREGRCGEHASI